MNLTFSKQFNILLFILTVCQNAIAEPFIKGKMNIDTTWQRVVYLSLIPSFDQLNSMSNQMIIESSEMDESGRFLFETDYLPTENHIYRIHLSKKGIRRHRLSLAGKTKITCV